MLTSLIFERMFNHMDAIDIKDIPPKPEFRRPWILYQLSIRGYSLASLAREYGKTRQQPIACMAKPYPKWEKIIATKLGCQPQNLWPERYDPYGTPLGMVRRSRPIRNVNVNDSTYNPRGGVSARTRTGSLR